MAILEIKSMSVRFGGLIAVNNLDMEVDEGEIRGLIGPNGAGKTTIFNTVSRYYSPVKGSVIFKGQDILKLEPHDIPKLGIGRTFQNLELFWQMSVLDNVLVGQHSRLNSNFLDSFLRLRRAKTEEKMAIAFAMELLDFVDLAREANYKAVNLPFGKLKKLELARALASKPALLLLDEPAAGMISQEIEEMNRLLKVTRDRWGVTIILVEHVMQLVMGISDRISVINFGKKIAEGTPEGIRDDQQVIEAYLGTKGQKGHAKIV
jgi:branched-chain amino acid transport system ATP-binding protein